MRVLIADGGTGGHIFPALAIADELQRQDPGGAVLFTGTAAGLEKDLVPRHGYELRMIRVGALIGKSWMTRIKTLMQLPFAFLESKKIVASFLPDLVIGFGAYASGPVLVACHGKRIPILLVEPNAIPGFTNRMMLKSAQHVAVPYVDTAGIYGGKAIVTGTPVRTLRKLQVQKPRFTLGVFGGSQGSRAINQTVVATLPDLIQMPIHVIHQTGKADFDSVQMRYQEIAPSFEVTPFVHDVEQFYSRCDLLLCRSGAITLAEITALGKPSILVPLPTAAHNHQEQNARRLMEAGAAIMILQKDLTSGTLLAEIRKFLAAPETLMAMGPAAQKLGKPDATRSVVNLAISIVEKHSGIHQRSLDTDAG